MTIKKISVHELRVGMHIQEFCGRWIDRPFWHSELMVSSETELNDILAAGQSHVWIDSAKGLDVGQPQSEDADSDDARKLPDTAEEAPVKVTDTGDVALARAFVLFRSAVPRMTALFTEARLGFAVDANGCEALAEEIAEAVLEHPGALINVVRLKTRDEYTFMHCVAVGALMVGLGSKLGLSRSELTRACLGGMLHDLGKMTIPLGVLNKPGKLTDTEWAMMKAHPERGHQLLLEGGGASAEVLDVCLHHHERIDGKGYPHGLTGDRISLHAKMGAVCDVYDALTSERPYKSGLDPAKAMRLMAQWKGHLDTEVYQAFVATVGIYPVGSLVRLESGKLAVVTAQSATSLLRPRVKAFFRTKSEMRINPEDIDLSDAQCSEKIVATESRDDWSFKELDQLWGAPQA